MNKKLSGVWAMAALVAVGGYAVSAAPADMENGAKGNNIVSSATGRTGNENVYRAKHFSKENGRVSFFSAENKKNLTGTKQKEQAIHKKPTGKAKTSVSPAVNEKQKADRGSRVLSKAKNKGEERSVSPENPLQVEADKIRYNDTTGDINLRGHILIKHMLDRYTTDYVYGNTLTQKYVIPGKIRWISPTSKTEAESAEYDASSAVGKFKKISGWDSDLYYFQGTDGIYHRDANKMVIKNGYFTTKHAVAKIPDYRIEADRIDIYPGDKYVAHQVKLKFKNTTVVSLSKYRGNLSADKGGSLWSLMPRPMYDSDNGWGLHNSIDIPLNGNNDLSFYMRNIWYSKAGYKPDIGVEYETPAGQLSLYYAEKESATNDEGGIWIKKKPSFVFSSRNYYFGKSPIYAGFRGEIGYWSESWADRKVEGPYKGFDVYISGPSVPLGKFLTFNWRIGHARDYYDYTAYKGNHLLETKNTTRTSSYYSLGLQGKYQAVSAWVNYTDRHFDGYSPYVYDTYSMESPIDIGFSLQLTPRDTVSISWSVDTANGNLRHRYYTYYRDMHSFYGWIKYDQIIGDVQIMISPKDFKF